eukprot:212718_1
MQKHITSLVGTITSLVGTVTYRESTALLSPEYYDDTPYLPFERQTDIVKEEVIQILDVVCGFSVVIATIIWNYGQEYSITIASTFKLKTCETDYEIAMYGTWNACPKFTYCGFHYRQSIVYKKKLLYSCSLKKK